ncbi:Phytanoyl-CoA dioxygenase [Aphelenchoides avenae]|nr:Phytanoyl-CoA dioxygenase [Aphelenchus avenae]
MNDSDVIESVQYTPKNLRRVQELLDRDGFVKIESVFSTNEVHELQREMRQIVDQLDPESQPKSVFTTKDEQKHASDRYFLDSVGKVSYFYEEGALDKEGNLQVSKDRALNKVGHALHWLNPVFKKYSFDDRIQNIIRACGFSHPQIIQSMYIFKQPSIGGAVTPHVDATFFHVEPKKHIVGVWIALDAATVENGCLWFIPGSHKNNKLRYHFVRTDALGSSDPLVKFIGDKPEYDESKFVPVEVSRGSLVLIDGLAVHKSEPNTSDKSRHAYTFHVVDRTSGTVWGKENWLQETDDYKFPDLF